MTFKNSGQEFKEEKQWFKASDYCIRAQSWTFKMTDGRYSIALWYLDSSDRSKEGCSSLTSIFFTVYYNYIILQLLEPSKHNSQNVKNIIIIQSEVKNHTTRWVKVLVGPLQKEPAKDKSVLNRKKDLCSQWKKEHLNSIGELEIKLANVLWGNKMITLQVICSHRQTRKLSAPYHFSTS